MIQLLNNRKMVETDCNSFLTTAFNEPSVNGVFSTSTNQSDLYSEQRVDLKMGRGSQSFVGAGASSSYSSFCKYRKEVMRQR